MHTWTHPYMTTLSNMYLFTRFTLYHPSLTDTRAPPRYVPHTALLASLVAIYAIFPPAYVLGPPRLGLPLLSASTGDAVVQNDHWVRGFSEREWLTFFVHRFA